MQCFGAKVPENCDFPSEWGNDAAEIHQVATGSSGPEAFWGRLIAQSFLHTLQRHTLPDADWVLDADSKAGPDADWQPASGNWSLKVFGV